MPDRSQLRPIPEPYASGLYQTYTALMQLRRDFTRIMVEGGSMVVAAMLAGPPEKEDPDAAP